MRRTSVLEAMAPMVFALGRRDAQSDAESEAAAAAAVQNLIDALLGHGLLIAACVMLALTLAWTAMRITSRRIGGHTFLPADYIYFAGQAFYAAFFVCCAIQDVYGHRGVEALLAYPADVQKIVNSATASRVFYILVLLCVKLSIAVLVQRVLGLTSRRMNFACWASIILCIGWAIYALVVFLTVCSPANGSSGTGEGCDQLQGYLSGVYAVDIFTDLLLFLLPLKMLAGLHMSKAHKIALLFMFSGGIVTMACSAAFLAALWTKADLSSIVGVVQAGIAIMVASSTVLRPLFDVTIVRWFNLESLKEGSGAHNINLRTWGGSGGSDCQRSDPTASRVSARRRDPRMAPVTESEENLATFDTQSVRKAGDAHGVGSNGSGSGQDD